MSRYHNPAASYDFAASQWSLGEDRATLIEQFSPRLPMHLHLPTAEWAYDHCELELETVLNACAIKDLL